MHLKQLVLRPSTGELRLVGKEWESEVERDLQHSKVSTFFTPSEVGRKEPAPYQVGCLQSAYISIYSIYKKACASAQYTETLLSEPERKKPQLAKSATK